VRNALDAIDRTRLLPVADFQRTQVHSEVFMRLSLAPVAIVLAASSAAAAAEGTAGLPQAPPPVPAQQSVLVPRGPHDILAGEGLGHALRGPTHGRIPQRRWHDEMPTPLAARDGKPLAGYHAGTFYLRDRFDNFRLYVGGNLHLDSLNYFGSGVSDTSLKSTVQVRRMRLTLGGEILGTWQFLVQPEWGSTTFDNVDGRNERSAADAGKSPDRSSAVYSPVQAGVLRASMADAYINYGPMQLFNLQVGQFQVPFTMDNRTSSNSTTFLETSLASRALGAPLARDLGIMAWGALNKNLFYYSAGVFLGEGPNRPNADNRADFVMRYYARPFARAAGAIKEAQIGFSFKYGMRDKNRVAYDYPAMTTQGGYAFWRPNYTDSVVDPSSSNTKGRFIHVIPSGAQTGLAAELRVPFNRFDLRSEFVYVHNNTREGVDGFQVAHSERLGTIKGWSYYVQLGYWIWGKPFLTGAPGEARPPRLDLNRPDPGVSPQAVELAVKWEQLRVSYDGASRDGAVDKKSIDGDIRVDAFTVGANYWATRHLRVSLDYIYYSFPSSTAGSSGTGGAGQRALAPGNQQSVNADARVNAHALHELSARVGFAF
jgi:phosphate-selective porin